MTFPGLTARLVAVALGAFAWLGLYALGRRSLARRRRRDRQLREEYLADYAEFRRRFFPAVDEEGEAP